MSTRSLEELTKIELVVEGMTCASCVRRVEKALQKVEGVQNASVNLATETAEVELGDAAHSQLVASEILGAVEKAGYKAHFATVDAPQKDEQKVTIEVTGMTCASCVRRVEKALQKVEGVQNASVNLATETAEVSGLNFVDATKLIDAVKNAGYGAFITGASMTLEQASLDRQAKRLAELRARKVKLLFGAGLSIAVLIVSYGFGKYSWSNIASLLLAAPVYFWVGSHFHVAALRSIRHGATNMDTLVSLGSSVAFFYSIAAVFLLSDKQTYFDVAAVIITLISLGKYLELAAKVHAGASLEQLMTLRPKVAHLMSRAESVVKGDIANTSDIPLDSLRLGDLVLVRPGEAVPTDGIVEEGDPAIDESLVTGESIPTTKHFGSEVVGGSINGMTHFVMRVSKTGDETVLAQIVSAVQKAQLEKSKVQRLADSVSSLFVPAIIILSVLTFLGWILTGHSFLSALVASVAVLVVACPCAMGLATPMATLVGTTRGAEKGLLLSGGDSLEVAKYIQVIVMDKTGTLTEGSPRVVRDKSLDPTAIQEYLSIAGALESTSEHPLARSIVKYADQLSVNYSDVELIEQKSESGRGVFGTSSDGEHHYRVGSLNFLAENGIDVSPAQKEIRESFNPTESIVALAIDKRVAALFGITDPIRRDAEAGIATLKALGAKVILASGDRSEVASAVASKLKMDGYFGDLKPQDKADLVAKLKKDGAVVAMVGDGINDAPALAVADVGIAVGSGTAMAMASADITLVHGDVSAIADAISLSRATRRIIWQNLGWAFGYNLILVPLAAFGVLPPIYAALAMATSSVSVVLNSLRLKNFRLGIKQPASGVVTEGARP